MACEPLRKLKTPAAIASGRSIPSKCARLIVYCSTVHAAFSSPNCTSTLPSAGITSIGSPPCHTATPNVILFVPFNDSASLRMAISSVRRNAPVGTFCGEIEVIAGTGLFTGVLEV